MMHACLLRTVHDRRPSALRLILYTHLQLMARPPAAKVLARVWLAAASCSSSLPRLLVFCVTRWASFSRFLR